MKISIVIPAYNEMQTLPELIELLSEYPALCDEIVVVDDGSIDGLKEWKTECSFIYPRVKFIHHYCNKGKGKSVWEGTLAAEGDIIVWMDADLEHDPADLPRILKPITSEKADLVYGNRYVIGDFRYLDLFWHRLGNRLVTFINSFFTGLDLGDASCGYRAFTKKIRDFIQIKEKGWGIEAEFNAKVAHGSWRIAEVPVKYKPRTNKEGKKIRIWHGLRVFWAMIKYNLLTK